MTRYDTIACLKLLKVRQCAIVADIVIAEKNGISFTKIREEKILVPSMTTNIFVTKYVYNSKKVGKAFCYEITENHGPDGFGTYMLTTQGDFDDMTDLYQELMNYYNQELIRED